MALPNFFEWQSRCFAAAFLAVVCASPVHADFQDQFEDSGKSIAISVFATVPYRSNGSTAKLNAITHIGNRIFVVESYDGRVYEITRGDTRLWFDVKAAIGNEFSNTDFVEGGLRSVAFHPEFFQNGKFYTSQDQRRSSNSATDYVSDADNPEPIDSVVSEWTMLDGGAFSGPRELFRIGQPGPHSIKQIGFNPNSVRGAEDFGLLYIAHGDGGNIEAGRGSVRNTALGKILRVDPTASMQSGYSIPVNNPFLGDASVPDEVYALGFRNPHNFSFTRSGQLINADIGSGNVEEINLVQSGADYGWGAREGAFQWLGTSRGAGISPLPNNDASFGYTYPAASFMHDPAHAGGLAIAGGYAVENNSALNGYYLFGEFSSTGVLLYASLEDLYTANTKGNPSTLRQAAIFRANLSFDHDGILQTAPVNRRSMLEVIKSSPMYATDSNRADLRFGQGPVGEVYISSKQNNTVYLVNDSTNSVDSTSSAGEAASAPTKCRDDDGDGWGWNGISSCQVEREEVSDSVDSTLPCIDEDDDGWGWNGVASCVFTPSEPVADDAAGSTQVCIDTDGDGWGWNGVASCVAESLSRDIDSVCVDTDGDGWGWNGESSCMIN